MKKIFFILCITFVCATPSVFAEVSTSGVEAFHQFKTIILPPIVVPMVVELPVETSPYERGVFAVYDVTHSIFVPYLTREMYTETPVPVVIGAEQVGTHTNPQALVDNNSETSAEYPVQEGQENTVQFLINANESFLSSSLFLELDQYVALPTSVRISALVDGAERVVVAETRLTGTVLHFPATFASNWMVTFTYAQPLRINELHIVQDSVVQTWTRNIRFLAQPGSSYIFYHDADRSVSIPVGESGNLVDDRDVLKLSPSLSVQNNAYRESDKDADGVIDVYDNCVLISNSDQIDVDKNGRGDVCDDYDRDGLMQNKDNCPNIPNVQQEDTDGDGIGDVCDGEESRLTEKYVWVPWVGMGIAALVLVVLFGLVAMTPKRVEEVEGENTPE